jgi:hypothetical protein
MKVVDDFLPFLRGFFQGIGLKPLGKIAHGTTQIAVFRQHQTRHQRRGAIARPQKRFRLESPISPEASSEPFEIQGIQFLLYDVAEHFSLQHEAF